MRGIVRLWRQHQAPQPVVMRNRERYTKMRRKRLTSAWRRGNARINICWRQLGFRRKRLVGRPVVADDAWRLTLKAAARATGVSAVQPARRQ